MYVLGCVPISTVRHVKVLVSNNCYSSNRYTLPRVALLIAATLSKKRRVGRKRASPFTARGEMFTVHPMPDKWRISVKRAGNCCKHFRIVSSDVFFFFSSTAFRGKKHLINYSFTLETVIFLKKY